MADTSDNNVLKYGEMQLYDTILKQYINNKINETEIPVASETNAGLVQVDGTTITINNNGVISAVSEIDDSSTSTSKTWSGDKIGQEISNNRGIIYNAGIGLTGVSDTLKAKLKSETASALTASLMTDTVNRQYAVGVDTDGYLSVNIPWTDTVYSLPIASTNDLGGVKIDGTTITIDNNGIISSNINDDEVFTKIINNDNLISFSSERNYNMTYNSSSNAYVSYNNITGIATYDNSESFTYELCSFQGHGNFFDNYIKDKKFLFTTNNFDDDNISFQIVIDSNIIGEINKNNPKIIIEFEEDLYNDYYIFIINTITGTVIGGDNIEIIPQLYEIKEFAILGSGLTMQDDILSSTSITNVNPLIHSTYTETIDGQTVIKDRLEIENYQFVLYKQNFVSLSSAKNKYIYFNTDYLGISQNTNYLYIDYSGSVTTTYTSDWGVRARLYQINDDGTSSLQEVMYLNVNGENYGSGTGGLNNGLNHFANYLLPNTCYRLNLNIYPKTSTNSNNTRYNISNINIKAYINDVSAYISPTHFQGDFKGHFAGNGEFNNIVLSKGTTDEIIYNNSRGSFQIDEEESDYYGAYFGLNGGKYISYSTNVDNNVTSKDYISITPSSITKFHQNDINSGVSGTTVSVQWDSSSDERMKENISNIDSNLSKELINITNPKQFNYLGDNKKHYGMIAQEVREQLNNLGETNAGLEYSIGDTETLKDQRSINYSEYIPHLVNYVKDLQTQINNLQTEIERLKGDS